jgi:Flp pilus assembly protein TadD
VELVIYQSPQVRWARCLLVSLHHLHHHTTYITGTIIYFYHLTDRPRPRDALVVLHNLATVTVQLGDIDAAIVMFNRINSIDPLQDSAHKALGVIYGKTGNLNGSAVSYRSCVVANPSNHECWCGLGNTLVRHNLGYDAIRAFVVAIRIQPNVAGYHNNLASTCVRIHGSRQAV